MGSYKKYMKKNDLIKQAIYHKRMYRLLINSLDHATRHTHYQQAKWYWHFFCEKIGKPSHVEFDTFAMQCIEGKIKYDYRSCDSRFAPNA